MNCVKRLAWSEEHGAWRRALGVLYTLNPKPYALNLSLGVLHTLNLLPSYPQPLLGFRPIVKVLGIA